MDAHFQKGIPLQPINLKLAGFPDNKTFSCLDMQQKRLVYVTALHKQIKVLQGDKVALLCMERISLYDSYEKALEAQQEFHYFDSQIFIPAGHPEPEPSDKVDIYVLPNN